MFGLFSRIVPEFKEFNAYRKNILISGEFKELRNSICSQTLYICKILDKDNLLDRIEASEEGSPGDIFTSGGRKYSLGLLSKFIQYIWLRQHVDFSKIDVVLEIGSGIGTNIELLLKLHPHLKVILIEIAPQLYFSQEYLAAIFGDEKGCRYSQMKGIKEINHKTLGKHMVFCLLPNMIDRIKLEKIDLYFNSASMEEMDLTIVKNYIKYLNNFNTRFVYLMNSKKALQYEREAGHLGYDEYLKYFTNYEILREEPAYIVPAIHRWNPEDNLDHEGSQSQLDYHHILLSKKI